MISLSEIINESILYVEKNDYKSFDIFDALTNPFLDTVTRKTPLFRRIAIQVNAKSPLNFRFIGMKRMVHTKTLSDMLSIYSMLFREAGDHKYLARADSMCSMLGERKISSSNGSGWGLNFPYATRFVDASVDTPNLYNTINCLNSLIDYFEVTSNDQVELLITDCVNFIIKDFGIISGENGDAWIRYYPGQSHPTYNVNALTIAAFCRVNKTLGHELVGRALISSLLANIIKNQNADGSWFYALSNKGEWVDGFHTGFILESLAVVHSLDGDKYDVAESIKRGTRYYIDNLFSNEQYPEYYPKKKYPIESQNCAQAIQTLANIDSSNINDSGLLSKVVENVTASLYDPNGYFIHKVGKFYKNKHIYFRWSQTPMIKALLHAKEYLER
jgi:polysaccharide biosynthesis protein VpsJ